VTGVQHWVLALFRQAEFFARFSLLFREFCHHTFPLGIFSTQGSVAALPLGRHLWSFTSVHLEATLKFLISLAYAQRVLPRDMKSVEHSHSPSGLAI
jgi:hypothetical protein